MKVSDAMRFTPEKVAESVKKGKNSGLKVVH